MKKRVPAPGVRHRRVVALAGRRIDSADSADSITDAGGFTLERVAEVASRLRATFRALRAGTLVCSAANGADLTALRVARELGMGRRIVLPFSIARFRAVSVTDRPGGELWGWLFDDLVADARATGDLIVLRQREGSNADAFEAVTERIVDEAVRCGGPAARTPPVGVVVWDGASRGAGDASAAFCERIRRAGYPLHDVRVAG